MAAEVGEQGGKKKRRKRIKAILAKIKDQVMKTTYEPVPEKTNN